MKLNEMIEIINSKLSCGHFSEKKKKSGLQVVITMQKDSVLL